MIALGDVAGKGSPAALLMALLLAMLRTLVDEELEPAALVTRLNVQVCRHAPGSRFITLLLRRLRPGHGQLHVRERRPHCRRSLLRADDHLRAAHRRRHRARHVRAVDATPPAR